MTKVLGLTKQPTFEEILGGDTYSFSDELQVFASASTNFRQGWFGEQIGTDEIVEDRTEQHHAVLAALEAVKLAAERQAETNRENTRRNFVQNLPGPQDESELASLPPGSRMSSSSSSSS